MISRERMEYKMKRDKAILYSNVACLIIINEADKSAFGRARFVYKTKAEGTHSIKIRLIECLEHKKADNLLLLTMTEEHETGENHVL